MKIVLQDGIKDCGVCSLLSIIRYYGGNVPKEYLREITNTSKNGVSAYNLVEASKKLGFDSYAVNGEIENIKTNNLPIIAHVTVNKSYKHFIVIYNIDLVKKKITVMDPAIGKRIISLSEFKLLSTNNYIFLTPIKKIPLYQDRKIIKKEITIFLKNNKIYLVIMIPITMINIFLNILATFHFKYILELSINYNIENNLLLISLVVFIIYFLKNIIFLIKITLLTKYTNLFDEKLTLKVYKQIILLPYLYYKNRTTGEVISRLKDLQEIKNFILSFISILIGDIPSIIIFIILLFNINPFLAIISISLFIIYLVINLLYKDNLKEKLKRCHLKDDKINSYLVESMSLVDAVKSMHLEKKIIDKFNIKYRSLLSTNYKYIKTNNNLSFLKNIVHDIYLVLIIYFGAMLVINKKINLSELIIYQSIFNFYLSSFTNVVNVVNIYPKYKVSKDRIEDIFTIKSENFINGGYYYDYSLNKKIVFKNFTYSYNSKKLIYKLNLCINSRDKIFFYGKSGSGKSTLVKVLLRYIEIPFNMLSINNIDINHYHIDLLRKKITYVSQQEFLFNDTIINNITLDRKVDERRLEEVLKILKIDFNLEMQVEENGFNFSGGERQRIILARSLLKDSDIYIFDEATNQIDIELERKIISGINKLLKDKIVIFISHRFDNKDLFKRKIKIEKGCIDEEKL